MGGDTKNCRNACPNPKQDEDETKRKDADWSDGWIPAMYIPQPWAGRSSRRLSRSLCLLTSPTPALRRCRLAEKPYYSPQSNWSDNRLDVAYASEASVGIIGSMIGVCNKSFK